MIRIAALALVALPLLAGCASDVPENVPLRGEWELTTTLDSVTVDGILLGREQVPQEMRQVEGTRRLCGEPYYLDASWQSDDIAARTKGDCELDQFTLSGKSARYGGSCEVASGNARYTPRLTGRSQFSQTTTRDVVTMEGSVEMPGQNGPHVLKMIAVQEGVRIGDC